MSMIPSNPLMSIASFKPTDIDRIVYVAHAHDLSVIARAPHIHTDEINRQFDRDVWGIMSPYLETDDQTRSLIDTCYFAPLGQRSWSGSRGTQFNDERPDFRPFANYNMLLFTHIKSQMGYDNLDAIIAIKSLNAIAFSPNDTAASLGFPSAPADCPETVRIHANIEASTHASSKRVSLGFTF